MNLLSTLTARPVAAAFAAAILCAIPASLALPAAPAVAQSSQSDLDRAIRAIRGITTLKADFVQTDRNGASMRGEITLKNPGQIRFEYSDDENVLIVANGSSLAYIDYDVQQLERWPIGSTPLGALLDPSRDLKRFGRLVRTTNPDVVSVEVSDPQKPEFGTMTLIFVRNSSAPGGLELTSWVSLDSQNTRTTVRLRNHRYGLAVPASTFRYRDPRNSSRRPR